MSKSSNSAKTDKPIEDASEIIERFGGIRPMAKKMGVAVTTVQGWKKRDVIPANRRDQVIEAADTHDIDIVDKVPEAEKPPSFLSTPPEDIQSAKPKLTETSISSSVANENAGPTDYYTDSASPFSDPSSEPVRAQKPHVSAQPDASAFASIKAERRNLDQRFSTTDKNSAHVGTWIGASLLILAIAGGAFMFVNTDEASRLAMLEEQQTEMGDEANKSFLSTLIPEDLDKRINSLQDQAKSAVATATDISQEVLSEDGGSVSNRMNTLNDRVKEETGLDLAGYFGLEGLMSKVETLEQSKQGQALLNETMAELSAVLSTAQQSGSNLNVDDQLKLAQEKMPALSETFEDVPPEDLKAAGLLLAMSQFRKSLNRDRDAFTDDLAVLKILVGDGDPELNDAIDRLAPYSEQGILTPDGLTNEFKTIAGDVVIASIKGEDISIQDKIKGRIGEVIQVERDGQPLVGNETQLTVSRAEKMLQQGNIQSAISLVEELDGPAATVVQPWIKQARATLSAQKMKGMINSALSGEGLPQAVGGTSGNFVRDKTGSVNVYTPSQSRQGPASQSNADIQKSIEDAIESLTQQ